MRILIVFVISVMFCISLIGCSPNITTEAASKQIEQNTESEPTKEPVPVNEPESVKETESPTADTPKDTGSSPTPEAMDSDSFIESVRSNIRGSLGARDKINDIAIENMNLRIGISLEKNDQTIKRFTDVTDKILSIKDGYYLWDSITIDFGSLGYIMKTKEDIDSSGFSSHFKVDVSDIVK